MNDFDRRSNHSIRCRDSIWSAAREASGLAGCSYSVFVETAILLLTRVVKEHGLQLEQYNALERWLEQKVDAQGAEPVLEWLKRQVARDST